MMQTNLDKDYWNNRYLNDQTGWDVGEATAPIMEYVNQLKDKNISILIPGCGNGYEAEYLLQNGFTNITLIDIAPAAVEFLKIKLRKWEGKQLRIICGDFFELNETFDLIIEQTFFCALQPLLRNDYVNKMADLIKDKGKLVGVLFNRSFEGGPPYGGSKAAYELLFAQKFNIKIMEDCYNSIAARTGTELFIIVVKSGTFLK